MKARIVSKYLLCLLLMLSAVSPGIVYPQPLDVKIAEITDTRSTGEFYGGCEIELDFIGEEVKKSFGIKDVRIVNAIDNLGRDLTVEDNHYDLFFNTNTGKKNILSKKVKLKNPSRSATLISTLEGYVELYRPTTENGGKLIVGNYLNQAGVLIHENTLGKYNMELMYLTKEIYDHKKELYNKSKSKELKNRIDEEIGDTFIDLFKGYFGSSLMDDQDSFKFYVKDKDRRLVDLQFLDKDDKLIEVWGRSSMGNLRTYSFKDLPPDVDSKLVIYIATDKSILNIKFRIDDIPLP